MRNLNRAFGSPDPEFQDRVRRTLFLIEEKEESAVKKKMTFSMALALTLCVCIVTLSAFAASERIGFRPDVTDPPLAQTDNEQKHGKPSSTPESGLYTASPLPAVTVIPVCYLSEDSAFYHAVQDCAAFESYDLTAAAQSDAAASGKPACPACAQKSYIFWPGQANDHPYYHAAAGCAALNRTDAAGSMVGTLHEALSQGKTLCPDCVPFTVLFSAGDSEYHLSEGCLSSRSGELIQTISLSAALNLNAHPCGECISDDLYYFSSFSGSFHSVPDCRETIFIDPGLISERDALSAGLTPCGSCCGTSSLAGEDVLFPTPLPAAQLVYSTPGGVFYHTAPDCSGMRSPESVYIATALNRGQTACPVCAGPLIDPQADPG